QPGDQSFMTPSGSTGGDGGQNAHGPESNSPYVFLDPWGQPFFYIEWASVPTNLKDQMTSWTGAALTSSPRASRPTGPGAGTGDVQYRNVHESTKFEIWS